MVKVMYTKRDISGSDALVQSLAGWPTSDPLEITRLNASHSNFERESRNRDTFVWFLRFLETVASRHKTQRLACSVSVYPKINGPLFYVYPSKVREGKPGWGNPGNGLLLDAAKTPTSRWNRELTQTYLPRNAPPDGNNSVNLNGRRVPRS